MNGSYAIILLVCLDTLMSKSSENTDRNSGQVKHTGTIIGVAMAAATIAIPQV